MYVHYTLLIILCLIFIFLFLDFSHDQKYGPSNNKPFNTAKRDMAGPDSKRIERNPFGDLFTGGVHRGGAVKRPDWTNRYNPFSRTNH